MRLKWGIKVRFIYLDTMVMFSMRYSNLMPSITLSEFIDSSFLDKFESGFVNSPSVAYKLVSSDTIKVSFQVLDHPFFDSKDSYNAIKNKDRYLVWKKDKFVLI